VKLDVFAEIQKAGPVGSGHEARILRDSIEQARAADAAGFGCWWLVEHHGCEEFSYSSAPELILAWIASETQRMRVGHAGVLAPFQINHPIRAAERAALLDHMSGGRLEFGMARSGGREWDTFGVDPERTRDQLAEALRAIPRMWTEERFSWDSPLLQVPARNIVPKPLQVPHPPLWQTALSPASFELAGSLGVGVLGNTLLTAFEQLEFLLGEYRRGLAHCEEPAGRFRNEQVANFTFVHVADSEKQAVESGVCLGAIWYMATMPEVFGAEPENIYAIIRGGLLPDDPSAIRAGGPVREEAPEEELPVIDLVKRFAAGDEVTREEAHEVLTAIPSMVVGDPETCRRKLEAFADLGVDRLMCCMQVGDIAQVDVLRSIRNVGKHLIPHFDR